MPDFSGSSEASMFSVSFIRTVFDKKDKQKGKKYEYLNEIIWASVG